MHVTKINKPASVLSKFLPLLKINLNNIQTSDTIYFNSFHFLTFLIFCTLRFFFFLTISVQSLRCNCPLFMITAGKEQVEDESTHIKSWGNNQLPLCTGLVDWLVFRCWGIFQQPGGRSTSDKVEGGWYPSKLMGG